MCTVTIWREPGRVLAAMNRDERRDRAPEEPPRSFETAGASYVAPRDGQAGGCWIAVNECGVAACLLNDYATPIDDGPRPTRGGIIPHLLERGDWVACSEAANGFDPRPYAPFSLLLLSLEGGGVWRWKGNGELRAEELPSGWSMLTSSSWNSAEVESERRRAFEEWAGDHGGPPSDDWPTFNRQRWEGREEWSPMMSRAHSATRSLTRVVIREDRARLVYLPAAYPTAGETSVELGLEARR